jgi:hypothetical protein
MLKIEPKLATAPITGVSDEKTSTTKRDLQPDGTQQGIRRLISRTTDSRIGTPRVEPRSNVGRSCLEMFRKLFCCCLGKETSDLHPIGGGSGPEPVSDRKERQGPDETEWSMSSRLVEFDQKNGPVSGTIVDSDEDTGEDVIRSTIEPEEHGKSGKRRIMHINFGVHVIWEDETYEYRQKTKLKRYSQKVYTPRPSQDFKKV